jgi:hypothetical protein
VIVGRVDGEDILLSSLGGSVLIAGASGGGKTTLAAGILERVADSGYQFCVVDPEGDYETVEGVTAIGDSQRAPAPNEVVSLLNNPLQNASVNLLGVELADRPAALRELWTRLRELWTRTGRPHWVILDEAHHLLPASLDQASVAVEPGPSLLLLTVDPRSLAPAVLAAMRTLLILGTTAEECVRFLAENLGQPVPDPVARQLNSGECLLWSPSEGRPPVVMETIPPVAERRRHRRKYAEGELGDDRSFFFRGEDHALNLKAHNLMMFMQIARGVGDNVWLYHLRRGDYTAWFREAIKDDDLAAEAATLEQCTDFSAADSRSEMEKMIRARYTTPTRTPDPQPTGK